MVTRMDMYIELLFKLVCVGDCVSLSSFNAREVFVHDPNLTAYRTTTTDTHSDMLTDETKLEKGWMTKEQVGDLNKIVPGVQNYQKKIDALVVGLPARPHRKAIVPIIACARHLLVRKAGIQAGRHTGRQAGRQAGRQVGRQAIRSLILPTGQHGCAWREGVLLLARSQRGRGAAPEAGLGAPRGDQMRQSIINAWARHLAINLLSEKSENPKH